MTLGNIHSIESMGLVDGPGIRTVVFFQGCRLRCRYCHNPDMWEMGGDTKLRISAGELVERLIRFRPYYGKNGGVTASGGEPLLQPEFLIELFRLCQEAGIHTCLDTAGCGLGQYEEILKYTDLVLFDVKHHREDGYKLVTGMPVGESLRFLKAAQKSETPMWIRHVVVPGLTDGDEHLEELEAYIRTLKGVEKVELLPYHTMGAHKYAEMGMKYPLEGVLPMAEAALTRWNQRINANCVLQQK